MLLKKEKGYAPIFRREKKEINVMNLTTSEKYNILRRSCNTLIKKTEKVP